MKLIAEITDHALGFDETECLGERYILRKSARAIVLNEHGEMAVQFLSNHGYHKLPGGGMELGETPEEALLREIREEVGCACIIGQTLGMVIQVMNEFRMIHISYGFVARVATECEPSALGQEELDEGQVTKWLAPATAAEQLSTDVPDQYTAHFILARERAYLQEYLCRV
jgi:ADP-ribose pyrophosphatase YjhB (NUDIX family)